MGLESVAVMEATQQNEYKLNVDHQTKQNKTPYPKCVRVCMGCIYNKITYVAHVCLPI